MKITPSAPPNGNFNKSNSEGVASNKVKCVKCEKLVKAIKNPCKCNEKPDPCTRLELWG